jgi:hypothetical protein
VDVPLVYLSTRLMPDIHPVHVQLDGAMRVTLLAWLVPVLMLAAGATVTMYRREVRLADARKAVDQPVPAVANAVMTWIGGAS